MAELSVNANGNGSDAPLVVRPRNAGFSLVGGDSRKLDYNTTMHSDFGKKILEKGGITAGRFSGFNISDRSANHITFGDHNSNEGGPSNHNEDHQRSVTKDAFKAPPQIANADEGRENKSIRETFHTKNLMASSSAHKGSQTRQDLPRDDAYFKNFTTTANDTYKLTAAQMETNRVIYGAKRSQLQFGDVGGGRKSSYETVQGTSYVQHQITPIQLKTKDYFAQSAIFNSRNYEHDDQASHYVTELSDAFRGVQTGTVEKSFKPPAPKTGELSHIQFGQDQARSDGVSVTKKDYGISAGTPFKKVPVVTAHTVKHDNGIGKAIRPTSEMYTKNDEHDEKNISRMERQGNNPPAGKSSTDLKKAKNVSSVPEGDLRYYNTGVIQSTSKGDFIAYPVMEREGRVNGPKNTDASTKTRIFNHDHDVDIRETYVTTSKRDFLPYSKQEANLVKSLPFRPVSGSNLKDMGDFSIPREMETTQHAHYTVPYNAVRRVPQKPVVGKITRLFPLAAKTSSTAYLSTFAENFPQRPELLFVGVGGTKKK